MERDNLQVLVRRQVVVPGGAPKCEGRARVQYSATVFNGDHADYGFQHG